jgi:hypothetical protein
LSRAVGKGTAAVLVVEGGDPKQYGSSSEWLKTFGLNLKERSSGKHMGASARSRSEAAGEPESGSTLRRYGSFREI